MLEQAFLGRPVVVRSDDEQCVGTRLLRRSRHDEALAQCELVPLPAITGMRPIESAPRPPDQFLELRALERRRFAGRAADDDGIAAVLHVKIEQSVPRVEIERAGRRIGVTSAGMLPLNIYGPWNP